jgi:hypothetical protein
MTVRGFLSWYLGSVIFVATAGATGYQILSRQHAATETAETQPAALAPSQPAMAAAIAPAPPAQRVPTTTPPAPSGLSAQDALALLPLDTFGPTGQRALPPLRRHTVLPDRHVVRHKPETAAAAARHPMPPPVTTFATAAPPRVTYYYAYPAYYPYAAAYPYGGYYASYPSYYRAF